MSHYYYIYGIYFESDIQLYHSKALEIDIFHLPDATIGISYHFIPEIYANEFENKDFSFISNRIWFKSMAGDFLIENGCKIYAAPKENISNSLLSAFIIGWCLNFLMYQRGSIGIHCSALSRNNNSFLISGLSGAGKSTTAMALINKGFKYQADDISFITSKNGYLTYPGLPLQKMCRDVAVLSGNKDSLLYIDELKDKFARINKEYFDPSPRKLSVFFQLEVGSTEMIDHKIIKGFDKVLVLLDSLFMSALFKKIPCPTEIKSECLKFAGEIQVVLIKRPADKNTTEEICEIITNYLEELCQP